ncbi:MAG TPA: hypothetical protein DCM59_11580 [Clostridium sp.]|nr:hypothetical protein [Clostridium sp.]
MKGFRKMDEMEQFISLKSLKVAYAFTIAFLFIWVILDKINKETPSIAFFLLITQNLVLMISQAYFRKKMEGK